MREGTEKVTLAIGCDDSNGSMLLEADIGVAIIGDDGELALSACDFAVNEFKDLWKLLFVHGRWSYQRTTDMILYFFYKNIIINLP